MTDEELASIRTFWHNLTDELKRHHIRYSSIAAARDDTDALLAEVERLRAREAAMREIVEAVARSEGRYASDSGDCCLYCAASTGPVFTGLEDTTLYHGEVCIVTKARALLGLETE